MAAEEHPVRVDGEPPASVSQCAQHGPVLAGRVLVLGLIWLGPSDGHHDVAAPRGLAQTVAAGFRGPCPPVDLLLWRGASAVERENRGVPAIRIVLRWQLYVVGDVRLAVDTRRDILHEQAWLFRTGRR